MGKPYLSVVDAVSGYGKKQILNGVSIKADLGKIVTVIGANGAGKSTLLQVIFGLLPLWQGSLYVAGVLEAAPSPRALRAKGIAYVPQGNHVFTDLLVEENLEIGALAVRSRYVLKERRQRVLSMFPQLERRVRQSAGSLSGGEKQMLALACALISMPKMLLLDEPSLGLAPPSAAAMFARVRTICDASGTGVLLVEQRVRDALEISDHTYAVRGGRVSYDGPSAELRAGDRLRDVYF